jgi:cytochrome c peroxidase
MRPRLFLLLPLALLGIAGRSQDPTVPQDGPRFPQTSATGLTDAEALGKAIFFDKSLSLNSNQSCATCHDPDFGFTGPLADINLRGSVYMGSVGNAFGDRRPPSAAYATQAPVLYFDDTDEAWVGGNFWDGRATGDQTGIPAGDQAIGPFLNPVEQALPDKICVLYLIAEGSYADLWADVHPAIDLRTLEYPEGLDEACRGKGAIPDYSGKAIAVDAAYLDVGRSLAAYEASPEVNAFSSKFDIVGSPGENPDAYTAEEILGWEVFNDPDRGNCAACHPSEPGPFSDHALFTDYTYDNLGIPANPLNPKLEEDPTFVDLGIGKVLDPEDPSLYGAVKVPTLRNVAKGPGNAPKSFGHNGVFKSLEQIVHFYNTRDVLRACEPGEVLPTPAGLAKMGFDPECWPAPEYPENVNEEELGALGLSPEQERAIVAFMKTLSDGWTGR